MAKLASYKTAEAISSGMSARPSAVPPDSAALGGGVHGGLDADQTRAGRGVNDAAIRPAPDAV